MERRRRPVCTARSSQPIVVEISVERFNCTWPPEKPTATTPSSSALDRNLGCIVEGEVMFRNVSATQPNVGIEYEGFSGQKYKSGRHRLGFETSCSSTAVGLVNSSHRQESRLLKQRNKRVRNIGNGGHLCVNNNEQRPSTVCGISHVR